MRTRRRRSKRGALLAIGSIAVVVSVLGADLAVRALGNDEPDNDGPRSAASARSPMTVGSAERDVVPDACGVVGSALASKLVPGGDRSSVAQGDPRHNECAWNRPDARRARLLSVELRAVQAQNGASATAAATLTFQRERQLDLAGDKLPSAQSVRGKRTLSGLGDAGYVVYIVDSANGNGTAVANVQRTNLLITVRFSGSDVAGKPVPLGSSVAMDGAVDVVKDIVDRVGTA